MPYIAAFLFFVIVTTGIAVNRVLKTAVVEQLKPLGRIELIPGFLQLTYVEDRGATFNTLANCQWLLVAATAVVCLLIATALIFYRGHAALTRTAFVLILASGVGNMIDRLRYQYVVDYIHFQLFPSIFDFAGIYVTVGCALLVTYLLSSAGDGNRPKQPGRYIKYMHCNQNRNRRVGS